MIRPLRHPRTRLLASLALASFAAPALGAGVAGVGAGPAATIQDRAQDPDEDEAEAERKRVEAALERIEQAFGKKDSLPAERVGALMAVAEVEHEKVVKAVAEALEDEDADVATAACDVLGQMSREDALEALHRFAKKHAKDLDDDGETGVSLYRAIGRHGSPDSIDLLTDKLFNGKHMKVAEARIFALGRIRSPKSLDAIFELMRKTDARKVQGHMNMFRFPLMVLGGVDHDLDPAAWQKWWKENRKTFVMAEEEPQLPKEIRRRWEGFWGEEVTYERNKRRDERGQGGG